jgi:hypothetical protein
MFDSSAAHPRRASFGFENKPYGNGIVSTVPSDDRVT